MFTWPRISSISSTSYPAHSSCVSISGHPSSTAARAARARNSSAPSSKARSLTAGRSACQHGSKSLSPANARKSTGTRDTRSLRVISSNASTVARSACVSSTSMIRSPAFPFVVRLAMPSPARASRGHGTVGRTERTGTLPRQPPATKDSSHLAEFRLAAALLILFPSSATLPRRMVTLQDVLDARERIRRDVDITPCPRSWTFSDLCGASVYFKLESLQRTGSFKERGAANKLSLMSAEERRRGVIAASAGNHASGVAYNAQRLGVKAVIVMPETTPLIKVAATKAYGAQVILCGTVFGRVPGGTEARERERLRVRARVRRRCDHCRPGNGGRRDSRAGGRSRRAGGVGRRRRFPWRDGARDQVAQTIRPDNRSRIRRPREDDGRAQGGEADPAFASDDPRGRDRGQKGG